MHSSRPRSLRWSPRLRPRPRLLPLRHPFRPPLRHPSRRPLPLLHRLPRLNRWRRSSTRTATTSGRTERRRSTPVTPASSRSSTATTTAWAARTEPARPPTAVAGSWALCTQGAFRLGNTPWTHSAQPRRVRPKACFSGFRPPRAPFSGVSVRNEHSRPAHDLGAGRRGRRVAAGAVQPRRPHQLGQRPPSRGRRLLDRRAHPVRHGQRRPHRAQPVRRPGAAAAPGRAGSVPAVPAGRRRAAARGRRPLPSGGPDRLIGSDRGRASSRRRAVLQRRLRPRPRAPATPGGRGSCSAPSTGCSIPPRSSART